MKTGSAPEASDVSAGPGQKPPSPQPAPKIAAPSISFASRSPRFGNEKSGVNSGEDMCVLNRYANQQAAEETTTPKGIAPDRFEDACENAADAGDLAVQQQHRRRTQTDEHTTE